MFVSKAEKQKGCSTYRNLAAIKNTKLFIPAEEKPLSTTFQERLALFKNKLKITF